MKRKPRITSPEEPTPLPVLGQPRVERADAARNRLRILDAARRIIAERGVEGLAVEAVASAAGVGVGTLYRRFGDRVGLAIALLDDEEREFQQAFMSGPPPLGPGADPGERLKAFLHAYADRLEDDRGLILVVESATGTRYQGAAYAVYRTHVTALLRAALPGDASTEYLGDAFLAVLTAELYARQRQDGMEADQIKAGLTRLVRAVMRDGR